MAFTKETIETILWKNCKFYWKQFENWGQWTLLIGMLIVWICALAVKPLISDSHSTSLNSFQKGMSGVKNIFIIYCKIS